MKDFLLAALPWVLMALPAAILAANHGLQQQTDKQRSTRIATGAALGLLLGVALNGCGLWESHALGFAIGPLWGMALATLFKGDPPSDDGDPDSH